MMRLTISSEELSRRTQAVRTEATERGFNALVLFSPTHVFYLTGLGFIATERPMALTVTPKETVLFVPALETEHATQEATVTRVVVYPEYPSDMHPMLRLKDLLTELRLATSRLGVDSDGYPGIWGYRGPKLSEVLSGATITVAKDLVEDLIKVKSAEELELIRESARWGNLAHALLQEYTRPGDTETEISLQASMDATLMMIRALGPSYRALSWHGSGAHAGFRGQIGKQSAIPHAITTNVKIQRGDVLVTGASASVGGYNSELERTMVVGEPTEDQARYFELMLGAQQTAIDAIRPGVRCSDVDRAVRQFFERNDLMAYWRHHVGHALGIGPHEAPFFDIGDDTVLQPGMVFSVEPGIYVPEFAGFRHSDTVVVTEKGMELMTYYPRDLASLTIPV
jgi:Xaa-Pro aminopeptidase